MKKIVYLLSLLALSLCAYSCQNAIDTEIESLTITATIAEPDASRVALTDNGETLRPEWSEGDKVIGFDEEGTTFEFTVESITDRRATMSAGGYTAVDGRKVYAIYAPGYEETAISDNKLTVNINTQNGSLNKEQPYLMCATATVVGTSINLVFENQVAVVGLKKFKINPVDAATEVDHLVLNGAVASGTFQIVESKLQLVPSGSPAPITAGGTWTTDASGVYDAPVYFAVLPTNSANLELHAVATNDKYVNLASIPATTLNAGYYYRMSKILDAVADVDGVKYDSIDAAWAAANVADTPVTVTLLANCRANAALTLNGSGSGAVTLDLNGKTLSAPTTLATTSYALRVQNARELTISDNSSLDVDSQGSIIGNSSAHPVYVTESTLTVTGGKIVNVAEEKYSIYTVSSSACTVSGGKLSSNGGGVYAGTGCNLNVTSGTIASNSRCIYAYSTSDSVFVTVSNGVFSSVDSVIARSYNKSLISITGGYYSSTNSDTELFAISYSGKCHVGGGCMDRPVNNNRCGYYNPDDKKVYQRGNSLNTDAVTKDTYPFVVDNYNRYWITTIGSYSYYFPTFGGAAYHANVANGDVTISPAGNRTGAGAVTLSNSAGNTITLDLKGYSVASTAESFISPGGTVVITDTGATKGEISTTKSKIIDITEASASVTLNGVAIKSTKATGASWNGDAVINMASSGGTLQILDSKIYSTKKLSTLRAYNGTTTIENSELSSGVESTGWYVVLGLNTATVTINSGRFYTSGTDNSSTCHIGHESARITVEDGYFYSEGRAVSSGSKSYYGRMTLNGGYYNKMPSVPSSGEGQDTPNYGTGLTMQSITPVSFPHSTITGKECGYQVKADGGEAEAQASTTEPVASYGTARTGGVNF